MRRPGAPGPTCLLCDVELHDDPHWHDIFQAWVCDTHCPCQFSDGSGPEPDDSDRVPPVPGDHDTTSAPRTAGVDVSAAIRAPKTGGAR